MIKTCSVDKLGECHGFTVDDESFVTPPFGDGLEGQSVTLTDGTPGVVTKVYSFIQTRQHSPNFVAVDITVEDSDDQPHNAD